MPEGCSLCRSPSASGVNAQRWSRSVFLRNRELNWLPGAAMLPRRVLGANPYRNSYTKGTVHSEISDASLFPSSPSHCRCRYRKSGQGIEGHHARRVSYCFLTLPPVTKMKLVTSIFALLWMALLVNAEETEHRRERGEGEEAGVGATVQTTSGPITGHAAPN